MEWIKCSEHLPLNQQMVIVYDGSDMFFATFYQKKDKRLKKRQGEFKIHGDDFWVGEITHWMVAPKLPIKEELDFKPTAPNHNISSDYVKMVRGLSEDLIGKAE